MIEWQAAVLHFQQEVEQDIIYENKLIYKRRLDLIIENSVLIELKTVRELDKAYYNKIVNYLRVFKIEVGLLINFGTTSLEFKRFVHTVQQSV